jgi:hypothetical protein
MAPDINEKNFRLCCKCFIACVADTGNKLSRVLLIVAGD